MHVQRRRTAQAGYSLVETLLVIGIMSVVGGMATMQIAVARPAMKGDSAMRVVMAQMRTARELAITQRRYVRVAFTTPGTVAITREEVPGPSTTRAPSAVTGSPPMRTRSPRSAESATTDAATGV